MNSLPEDGIPEQLLSVEDNAPDVQQCAEGTSDANVHSSSFLPLPNRDSTEEEAIRRTIDGSDPLEWPTVGDCPINELKTPGLRTMAFPTLFPYGKGDPTCPAREYAVTLTEAFKHLICYADAEDGNYHWRFASHPRFPYWALRCVIYFFTV